jgi:hypothetical protein
MPLDGLRAWIGEVERKLAMRTRVFLVLSLIAIGGAGAAIYLAVEAKDDSVSEGDVQALQRELEARIDSAGATGGAAELARVGTEVSRLKAEVAKLKGGEANGSEAKKAEKAEGKPPK